ncbi:MAG: hypothetical protein EZS28_040982 [Streblomastix strix]|uniref:Uncharacterized protein n=1 Tax=Streblomastix strix TaxID=222440 RepID=A0A5J4TZR6_9EUKA|nr:MAG: hypothetical protein EZS28_040982 [Streblomastix strix]
MVEVISTSAIEDPDGSSQFQTEKRKGGDESVQIAFRGIGTESYISKSVHEVMKFAGIEVSYIVMSIRSSSITKQISIRATKQQVNRFSHHKNGLATVSKFYDKNLNDNL